MMFSRAAVVALVAAVGCAAPAAGAEKSGSFTLIGSFQHDYSAVEHADGTIFGGPLEGTGTIVESSGGLFAAGAHSHVKCVAYGRSSAAGMDVESACTMTGVDGDRLYLWAKRDTGDVAGGEGSLEVQGGTGRFAGVTGQCAYESGLLAGNWVVTTSRCQWRQSAGAD